MLTRSGTDHVASHARRRQGWTAIAFMCAGLLAATASAQEPPAREAPPEIPEGTAQAILVIDASNSMWGQIDGTAKIEIAREAVHGLLDDWDPEIALGLMAYGHRREGDCTDIEMIAPVGAADRPELETALDDLTPRGKTPMSEAVRQAAEQLSYADRPATVILVSDGRETCNVDPCEVASELERRGVAFTAHVVGFDVAEEETIAQLQCIAENTGGRYVAAGSAEELSAALEETGGAAADATLRLRALEGEGGPVIASGIDWTIRAETGTKLPEPEGARPDLSVPPGEYTLIAERDGQTVEVEAEAQSGETELVTAVFPLPEASLEAPGEVEAGAAFTVSYTGPGGEDDYITYAEPDAHEGAYNRYEYVQGESGDVTLRAPDETGSWELRYMSAAGRTLATANLVVTETEASLSAPESVPAGSSFEIAWTGPANEDDYITIVRPDAREGAYNRYEYVEDTGGTVSLRAPDETGTWEVRYVSGADDTTFARTLVEVSPVKAALDAPETASAGSSIEIGWTGPGNEDDYITIVEPEAREGAYTRYEYTEDSGGTVSLRVPDEAGSWEIRYVSGAGDATLASRTIEVEPVEASLAAEETVLAGARFAIDWTGPANEGDYITIVEPDAAEGRYGPYEYVENTGGSVTMRAPDEPGTWEIRYLSGAGDTTFARTRFEVEMPDASLETPKSVEAGESFTVRWSGPQNEGDFLTIVEADTPEGRYGAYEYVEDSGGTLEMTAPDEPGTYEVRYLSGNNYGTFARSRLEVTEAKQD